MIPRAARAFTSTPGPLCAGSSITRRKNPAGRSGPFPKERTVPSVFSSSRHSCSAGPAFLPLRARMHDEARHHLPRDFASSVPGRPSTTVLPVMENPSGKKRFHRWGISSSYPVSQASKGSARAGTPTESSGPRLIFGRGVNPSESRKLMEALAALRARTEGMAIWGMKQALPLLE